MLFVERRDGQTVPIDTRQFAGVQHCHAHTEYREHGSTRYAELHLVDQHVNQRNLVVGMTRHTHRYGMHYSAEAVGSFENLVQFGERSRDEVSLADFAVRDLAAEQREAQKQAQLRGAIERELEAAAERKAERERNADMAFYIERELRDRGVRTISRDDIFKIMPEVRKAASKYPTPHKSRSWRRSCKRSSHQNSREGCDVSCSRCSIHRRSCSISSPNWVVFHRSRVVFERRAEHLREE